MHMSDRAIEAPEAAGFASPPGEHLSPLALARRRMTQAGLWNSAQHLGRRFAIGCVALEITQRCNLDCTLCYLSESSEALKDIPLEELHRRLEMIRAQYGPGTDVQITGGEPTLRRREELLAIVGRAKALGLRPALFTNGILATRDLLADLCAAGLVDVAFHVDMSQQRGAYVSESGLNALRAEYIERARDLPLAVYFNTTVFDANFEELPSLVRFFIANADRVSLASFQLQADTGRGVLGARGHEINPGSVAAQIRLGAAASVDFDAYDIGHRACNRYAMTLVANGCVHDLLDDHVYVRKVLDATAQIAIPRGNARAAVVAVLRGLLRRPRILAAGGAWLLRKLWRMRRDLLAARGRVHKLSFFIHNFMDAKSLEQDRVDACSFMVATAAGPVSMCRHNANRDDYLLTPIRVARVGWWDPLSGAMSDAPRPKTPVQLTRKTARGKARLRGQVG